MRVHEDWSIFTAQFYVLVAVPSMRCARNERHAPDAR